MSDDLDTYTCIGRNDARLAIALGCCTMPRSAAGDYPRG